MGAIELQVFVSLVVVLGAAFVALICDFLKGNNEQLRESNIEMRVRQDEREKREVILGEVQRHTIETLVQARVSPAPVAALAPQAAAELEQPIRQSAAQAPDARVSFERTQQERSTRRREFRRQQSPPATVSEPPVFESGQDSAWAESVVVQRSERLGTAPMATETSVETDLLMAGTLPVLVQPATPGAPLVHSAAFPFAPQLPPEASAPFSALTLGAGAMQPRVETLASLPLPLPNLPTPLVRAAAGDIPVTAVLGVPRAGLSPDAPVFDIVETAAPVAETEAPVVRIRVLSENEILHYGEPLELELPVDNAVSLPAPRQAEAVMAYAVVEPMLAAQSIAPALPAAGDQTIAAAELEPSAAMAAIEPLNLALRPPTSLPIPEATPLSPLLPVAQVEPRFSDGASVAAVLADTRSNVVQMPVATIVRNSELAPPELVIPGGFHEAPVLARLLEEETPFVGLALVISVVDYVVLLADQGKPAVEQLMGSVTRLVMSLAREQDFACRIAEDEFVLLFAQETGAAAKRRIQSVSERLWDFQLRSLGSVSVIFSWGASESTSEAVVHAVEFAREQMLESRRNRRALASGVGRFRRRVANS
ncbi:MAG: hypothetical protein IPP47_24765 [Bryobacterales bacterium]|nr:hypothetical protein [Bryobacterales bacterium]